MTINQSKNREITAPGPGVEKPQPETSGALATEHQAPLPADSLSAASTIPAPGAKTGSHALVEKYEIGSGKNRINVRIFRVPPAKPDIPELGKEAPIG
jgi:hypothetical protein